MMKKEIIFLLWFLVLPLPLQAEPLTIEITSGIETALPIAIVPFGWHGPGQPPEDIQAIIAADLARSGRFAPLAITQMLSQPQSEDAIEFRNWQVLGVETLVIGQLTAPQNGHFEVQFQLFDVFRGQQLLGYRIPSTAKTLRATAHRISDLIYEQLLGEPGAFATRIAYITDEILDQTAGHNQIALRIADTDGYNSQTIVQTTEPLLSPAWSPDGQKIAYVSFEAKRPAIFIQEVYTGQRQQVASYQGINSAPAWSPDGRELAMTLSKDGNPDIFVLNLASGQLRALTRHYAIDTEPAWSPDSRSIVFTSDRGGSPQIYRVSATGGKATRLTFENNYNACASYSPDGKSLVLVTRVGKNYRIALFELKTKLLQLLTDGQLDESPSFAPNSSMILYAGKQGTKSVLYAVSADGRIRQRLALSESDVREPAWSPYFKR